MQPITTTQATTRSTRRRTMIIIWSWRAGGLPAESAWEINYGRELPDRMWCWDMPASPAAEQRLREQLRELIPTDDVFLFLHRRHNYTQESVGNILTGLAVKPAGRLRCFLFGEGGDPLYLLRNPRGLLGANGSLYLYTGEDRQAVPVRTAVADQVRGLIKAEHFDSIWQLYEHAFKSRIFELKEDCFNALQSLLPRTTFPAGAVYNWLKQPDHRLLLLRLLSFSGRLRRSVDLSEELREYERHDQRYYLFDDLGPQLASVYGEATGGRYRRLSEIILQTIIGGSSPADLLSLREAFQQLLDGIPGAAYD